MTQSTELGKTTEDRILLPFTFDTAKMQEEYKALNATDFEYYNVILLRAPAHIVDPSRPFPPPADDYADGSWTDWLDTAELKKSPYLMSIVDSFREHTTVTLVRLLRLAPQATVAEHTDPTLGLEVHKSVIRLTVPILRNEEIEFYLNGTTVPLKPGECWYMRLTDPHKVVNPSDEERVSLTIDMIPNEWIRNIIEESRLVED